eukprot:768683-Hanusia_phi.AAC.14
MKAKTEKWRREGERTGGEGSAILLSSPVIKSSGGEEEHSSRGGGEEEHSSRGGGEEDKSSRSKSEGEGRRQGWHTFHQRQSLLTPPTHYRKSRGENLEGGEDDELDETDLTLPKNEEESERKAGVAATPVSPGYLWCLGYTEARWAEELFDAALSPADRQLPRLCGVGDVADVEDGLHEELAGSAQLVVEAVGLAGLLEVLEQHEVLGHVREQNHVDDRLAQLQEALLRQVVEDVYLGLRVHAGKEEEEVIVLLHALVVVHQCAVRDRVLVIVVVEPIMPEVVNKRCQEDSLHESKQEWEVGGGRREERLEGEGRRWTEVTDVGRVDGVVVRVVLVLRLHEC